eukprot:Clim_evm58s108 gene=Clim_evmTU58s108
MEDTFGPNTNYTLWKPQRVVVHPLVLLSVVDHYNRVAKNTSKRVVGVLLGARKGNELDVSNSFAVPFEEDEKDPSIHFLDHNYLENMFNMFRKVNARERVVGWYSTGPALRKNDMLINDLIRRFSPNAVLVIIEVTPREMGIPTDAYYAVEEVHDDGTPKSKTFEHIPSEIGAEEAEEVGVEHLLRDIKDSTAGTLAQRISNQMSALRSLKTRLDDVHQYVEKVHKGELPINYQIMYQLQDLLNLLPNLNLESLLTAFSVKTNDQFLIIYLAAMIRSIIALHNLIDNKIENREHEQREDGLEEDLEKEKEKKAAEEKDKADKKDKETAKADGS